MPAQDADAQRMERRYVRFGFPFSADQFADPLLHFVGGFVGEGHCQDALRFNTLVNKLSDARRHDARLAAACPGQHEQRARFGENGVALGWIQRFHKCPIHSQFTPLVASLPR